METKNLKHIAVVEARTKSELLRKINDEIDSNGLELINYRIEEEVDMNDQFEKVWAAELFFKGPMVFDYDLSGEDAIMAN